ncbi:expressed protein [Batrachochytrium dendrobatidis JAM81]|uniref:Expressed protein n=1 Tax=Batrachochytrium dendrobatidis (strain JAM81 / FGSC 10211) TaxID=684364 RepID=F4P438_BATDJ|nr:uncharacterized protein BATDEDRAFT_35286 [Batrachochytrium dendrobatidis JAM81]EGF79971.1 expressed protein [Batrachochytrium dendrobatidis JAM81]|eukprot:XP_006679566.1 expressed protein [Batrachochytrium dendrobatidis JAM81]
MTEGDQPRKPQTAGSKAERLASIKTPRIPIASGSSVSGDASTNPPSGSTDSKPAGPKFAPTIPVRRNKKEAPKPEIPQDNSSKRGRGRGRGQDGVGRGRGRGRGRLEAEVTASGPFALGPAQRGAIQAPRRMGDFTATIKHETEDMLFDDAIEDGQDSSVVFSGDIFSPLTIDHNKNLRRIFKSERSAQEHVARSKLNSEHVDDDILTIEDPLSTPMELDENEDENENVEYTVDGEVEDNIKSELAIGDLLFFQFPLMLPKMADEDATTTTVEGDAFASNSRSESARSQPSTQTQSQPKHQFAGKAGQFIVRKSGRTTLMIGGVEFEVKHTPVINFTQSVTYIDQEINSLYFLGDVQNRFVCSPSVNSLIG